MIGTVLSIALRYWRPLAGVLLVAAILGGTYAKGRNDERGAELVRAAARAEAVRMVEAQLRLEADKLATENAELRARPARIRTIVKEVASHVQPDADCRSLPASWGVLWNVHPDAARDPAPGTVAHGSPADVAGTANRIELGDAADVVGEGRARFEQCTGQVIGLQRYVERICLAGQAPPSVTHH